MIKLRGIMKNILIAGSPRSGKSLLSMEIKRRLPNLNILCVDDLRDAIRFTYNVDYRMKEHEEELNAYFYNLYRQLLDFNNRYKDDGNTYFLIEGTNFTVEEVLKNYNDGSCLVIFVGKPQLSGEEYYQDMRSREEAFDSWTKRRPDELLRIWAQGYADKSRGDEIACKQNNWLYLDTSFDQNKKLSEFADELAKKLLNETK